MDDQINMGPYRRGVLVTGGFENPPVSDEHKTQLALMVKSVLVWIGRMVDAERAVMNSLQPTWFFPRRWDVWVPASLKGEMTERDTFKEWLHRHPDGVNIQASQTLVASFRYARTMEEVLELFTKSQEPSRESSDEEGASHSDRDEEDVLTPEEMSHFLEKEQKVLAGQGDPVISWAVEGRWPVLSDPERARAALQKPSAEGFVLGYWDIADAVPFTVWNFFKEHPDLLEGFLSHKDEQTRKVIAETLYHISRKVKDDVVAWILEREERAKAWIQDPAVREWFKYLFEDRASEAPRANFSLWMSHPDLVREVMGVPFKWNRDFLVYAKHPFRSMLTKFANRFPEDMLRLIEAMGGPESLMKDSRWEVRFTFLDLLMNLAKQRSRDVSDLLLSHQETFHRALQDVHILVRERMWMLLHRVLPEMRGEEGEEFLLNLLPVAFQRLREDHQAIRASVLSFLKKAKAHSEKLEKAIGEHLQKNQQDKQSKWWKGLEALLEDEAQIPVTFRWVWGDPWHVKRFPTSLRTVIPMFFGLTLKGSWAHLWRILPTFEVLPTWDMEHRVVVNVHAFDVNQVFPEGEEKLRGWVEEMEKAWGSLFSLPVHFRLDVEPMGAIPLPFQVSPELERQFDPLLAMTFAVREVAKEVS